MLTIIRTYISYKPMLFFTTIGSFITGMDYGKAEEGKGEL